MGEERRRGLLLRSGREKGLTERKVRERITAREERTAGAGQREGGLAEKGE